MPETRICRVCNKKLLLIRENFPFTHDKPGTRCHQCFRDYMNNWYSKNKKKSSDRHKYRRATDREEALQHFSKGEVKCVCCGESNHDFLTLDHKNGWKYKRKHRGARDYYYRNTITSVPKSEIQILCFNCNCGRARFADGICPHKRKKVTNASN